MEQRKNPRLPQYDYATPGVYFVTICTEGKRKCLVDVRRGGVLPRPLGTIVENEILALTGRYHITIDHYVVMPNHVHILLTMRQERQSPSPTPTLGHIIGALKSITTKEINRMEGTPGRKFWQRSYYDHIIRNDADYLRIRQYIDDNPARWPEDEYYA